MCERRCVITPCRAARLGVAAIVIGLGIPGCPCPENPTDTFLQVPAPLSGDNPVFHLPAAAVPVAGGSVTDAAFDTSQRRVTQTESLRHEYSRIDPFNCDHSLILLMYLPDGEWRVYETASIPYDQAGNLVRTVAVEEPRWDPTNPRVLWGTQEFRIGSINVDTGEVTTAKDFAADPAIAPILSANPDLYRITMRDEGESSINKRYWIFAIQGEQDDYRLRCLFTWDRVLNQVLGIYTLPQSESLIDWVGMSPLGTYALIGGDYDNGGNLAGLTMANRELTQFHRLDFGTAHSDVGLDSDGNEIIVMQNVRTDFIDLIPLDLNTQPILEAGGSYGGTNRVALMRLYYDDTSSIGLRSGIHISCNFPGYALISTYTAPDEPEQNWLDRTVTVAALNPANPRVFYLVKIYGTTGAYWEETHATISVDGSRVLWTTNWNLNVGQERVWEVQLDLPAGWTSLL